MGASPGENSLHSIASQYLKVKFQKPGNVYLGVVSRIDAFVTGVIVFARTSKAAARLNEQFRSSQVKKTYLAIVRGKPCDDEASDKRWIRLESYLRKNDKLRRVESFDKEVSGSKVACLEYRVIKSNRDYSLLEIDLKTGRKHQIRAQFSELNCPIYADRKYDATENMGNQIALHAYSLSITHPTLKENMTFTAPVPQRWHQIQKISDLLVGI